jgi:hypothetical protein
MIVEKDKYYTNTEFYNKFVKLSKNYKELNIEVLFYGYNDMYKKPEFIKVIHKDSLYGNNYIFKDDVIYVELIDDMKEYKIDIDSKSDKIEILLNEILKIEKERNHGSNNKH